MNKKQILGAMAALTVVGVTAAGPAAAQDGAGSGASGQGDQGTTRTAASNQQPDDNSNWGWLGLLGLAGLAGLRKPAQTVVRQDKDGAARAY